MLTREATLMSPVTPQRYSQHIHTFEWSRELARFTPTDAVPGPELRVLQVGQ